MLVSDLGKKLPREPEGSLSCLRQKVTGGWRRFQSDELRDLCFASYYRAVKWRRMRWAGHVARMEIKIKCVNGIDLEN
jgi:hypothetical protein